MEKSVSATFERTVEDLQRAVRELVREAPLTAVVNLLPQATLQMLMGAIMSPGESHTPTTWKLTATWEEEPRSFGRLSRHVDAELRNFPFPDLPASVGVPDVVPSAASVSPVDHPDTELEHRARSSSRQLEEIF